MPATLRREFSAKIVVTDDRTDLAILQVDTGGELLPVLALRDSDELEVGDLVLAIGNPFGVGQTVTSGIVSGVVYNISCGISTTAVFSGFGVSFLESSTPGTRKSCGRITAPATTGPASGLMPASSTPAT